MFGEKKQGKGEEEGKGEGKGVPAVDKNFPGNN